MNAFIGLGLAESLQCGIGYMHSRIAPVQPEPDFETSDLKTGLAKGSLRIFFRTSTEKVWGISCKEVPLV